MYEYDNCVRSVQCGKKPLVKHFVDSGLGRYELARSVTTREPRSEGEYYTFVSREVFKVMYDDGAFLETNLYQGSKELYGTPKVEVERILKEGKIPILEIDVNGKQQIEKIAVQQGFVIRSVFIAASPETTYKRLIERGDSLNSIVDRLVVSYDEVAAADTYDNFIVNQNLEIALNDMRASVEGTGLVDGPDVLKYRKELMALLQQIKEGVGENRE